MKTAFEEAFGSLNKRQLEAVEEIDGPVLVIAGPGTGKTQLLGTRIGHILNTTDTDPSNILALTFTDAGVDALRQRLDTLIPKESYKVNITTYHSFGSELIRNNLEYFEGLEAEPLDELGQITALRAVIEELPYSSPFKFAEFYQRDLLQFISEAKRALLKPTHIRAIAKNNIKFITGLTQLAKDELGQLTKTNRISKDSGSLFESLLNVAAAASEKPLEGIEPLQKHFIESLGDALDNYAQNGKTTPLTAWKNAWLAKDTEGRFVVDGQRLNKRLQAAATVYENYQKRLAIGRLYDYDDMILRAIEVLEAHPNFKYSLAERYQYIMLDEFQDTNAAQMKLIELLSDHPVHESRPNVMAVGDDDQAIYAFQGANYGNMAHFINLYREIRVISLAENYRAHPQLVSLSEMIANNMTNRLHESIEGIEKTIVAANKNLKYPLEITLPEFKSDAAQYQWIALQIKKLVRQGIPASEIAVIAPKHKYLKPILPYLATQKLPVSYEKRENVLDKPVLRQLEQMALLVVTLSNQSTNAANYLWAEVLSYDFWNIPTEELWEISWEAKRTVQPWTALLLKNSKTADIAKFFLRLKDLLNLTTLEEQLDALIGMLGAKQRLKLPIKSPLYEYYFGKDSRMQHPADFTDLISNLSLLRASLRIRQRSNNRPANLTDFIDFTEAHRQADINILDRSPYFENAEAVNVLTAYGAKGKEFEAVFVVACLDEVWGSASRSQGAKVKLPANLEQIRYQGMSENERLKLFYVAITRAKTQLYLTSYEKTLDGKAMRPLSFLAEGPKPVKNDADFLEPEAVRDYWTNKHLPPFKPKLKHLLEKRLDNYKLSATHLNAFVDLIDAGPEDFFIHNLLGFPRAPTVTSTFGSAMHATLSWTGNQLVRTGKLPTENEILNHFSTELVPAWLTENEFERQVQRGKEALKIWIPQRARDLSARDRYEFNFAKESSVLDGVHLSGKIDRLVADHKQRTVTVIDFKTGKALDKFGSEPKGHKFRQQLMFYKLLVENSSTYKGYKIEKGVIEFVEPNEEGKVTRLELSYEPTEMAKFERLVQAVWVKIQKLDFPDASGYPVTMPGIKSFENDLANLI
ncbi:ATP-dependent helicase [Candidatus Saccharibacteria bacterium]|nr:ATP-dependent helicase [Candidatus Saccharibacteria bacterium]